MTDPRTLYLTHERLTRDQAEANIRAEVARLRSTENGLPVPWQVIADALGITRQAAWERYRR